MNPAMTMRVTLTSPGELSVLAVSLVVVLSGVLSDMVSIGVCKRQQSHRLSGGAGAGWARNLTTPRQQRLAAGLAA